MQKILTKTNVKLVKSAQKISIFNIKFKGKEFEKFEDFMINDILNYLLKREKNED